MSLQTVPLKDKDLELKIKTVFRAFRVPIPLDNQIRGVARQENLNYSYALIATLNRRLKEYMLKTGLFYCQNCSGEFNKKKIHLIPVGIEEFIFCDECFFSEKYKEFIRRIL